jgi:hypothetical protein
VLQRLLVLLLIIIDRRDVRYNKIVQLPEGILRRIRGTEQGEDDLAVLLRPFSSDKKQIFIILSNGRTEQRWWTRREPRLQSSMPCSDGSSHRRSF